MATHAKRILVVDDSPTLLKYMELALQGAGHEVRVADTGQGAVEALRGQPFDLLVIDKILPDMNGLDVLKAAREVQPAISGVMITGAPTEGSRKRAKALGANVYLKKPFDSIDLVHACNEALGVRRLKARSPT